MKLPSYLAALFLAFAAVVAAPPQTSRAEEATFDVFYTTLADEGDWYNTPDYGYVWQPYVAYQNDQWRPYTDGYWAQTDAGWTWVSYENFGWATYHYGRWTQLEGTGWVWVPGYEWGPGWVSWRQNDSYVGWAPIPPKRNRVAVQRLDVGVEPEPAPAPVTREPRGAVDYDDLEDDYDTGYNASVDTIYDIGPAHYCFVPVASFGAPYVREVILAPEENFVIIGNTYNCTNICYRRGPRDVRFVYGGGPDFGFISRHVQRPIPRLFLDRRTDIGVSSFAQRGFSPLSVVRGDRLQVVGPQIARREVRFNDVRPPRVRENIAQVRTVNGWRGIQQNDQAAAQRLRAQYRQEAQVAPPARDVVSRLAAPAEFRPNAPVPAPLPPPPQARVVREQQPAGGGRNINPPAGTAPGATAVGPQPGQPAPATANGLQPMNPAGRGAQNADEREARRNAQFQQMNERRAARGQPPLQPSGNIPGRPGAGAATTNANPAAPGGQPAAAPPQTREQARATRLQQQREAQQAAQQQRQQAAEQQRQQQAAAAEQRRQQQQAAAQERTARQGERRGQPQQQQQQPAAQSPQTGDAAAAARQENAATRRAEAAEAARAQQERTAQERSGRQAEAQQQQQQRAAARERAEAGAAQARQQQQAAATERQHAAAEARQQQQQAATAERQRANAEARQQQQQAAQQQRAAAQAEARQQQAAQVQQQRAAAQQQAQQQQAAQRAQRQQAQPQQEGQSGEGGKRKRPPEGQ